MKYTNSILTGDVYDRLPDLPDESVHMVMTSPPYWNLRDYGEEDQLGLEETPEGFVDNLVDVFDEVKRVLRPDGSLWLNLGDTYDDKDLQQIPARVALELQDRGWILRNRVTWAKPNAMPQSVKDRLNDTTEVIFHFVKNKEYWYDLDAIREEHGGHFRDCDGGGDYSANESQPTQHNKRGGNHPAGKNPGDVFEVTTKPFPEAHFAVYPPELCEKPIKATCPPTVCAECGSPYERDVVEDSISLNELPESNPNHRPNNYDKYNGMMDSKEYGNDKRTLPARETVGWERTCDCDTDATEAGIALDPFAGAGTTLLKAKELGRKFVGIELNPEYADMARARVGLSPHDPSNVRNDDDQSGLEAYADGGDS